MCVTSDFKFKLADNTDISMKDFIIASGIDIDDIQNKQWIETKNKLSVKTPKGEKVVDRIWFNGFAEVYQLTFKKGDVEETIKCTDHHKFLSVDGTWKETVFAELGETFDGGWTLVAKDLLEEKEATFDIDVPEEHAYIMSNGMVTHNSSSVLCGGSSQGIEPIFSNVYQQKMAGGTVNRISQTLLRIMKERGVYSQELVDEIGMKFNGSVQDPSITFLTPHEKLVFKTANEIDQKVIIDLAADRQDKICQAQSINLFFKSTAKEKDVSDITQYGMSKKMVKSLYYQRSEATTKGSTGKSEPEACIACEA